MSHQSVDAGRGASWIAQGWGTFIQSPLLWIVVALIFAVIYFVLSLVPLIGPLAAALLAPALFGGMVYGARELGQDRSLEVGHLFQAFRESGRAGPMIGLGLVPLVAAILTGIVMAVVIGGVVGGAMMGASGDPAAQGMGMGMMAGGGLVGLLITIAIGLVTGALLLFSIPRVLYAGVGAGQAVRESGQAVLANIGAYIVFAILYVVLSIIAAIPLGLGFLILLPVMAGAVYHANREVFGDEVAATGSGPDADAGTTETEEA